VHRDAKVHLTLVELKVVAKAYLEFITYLDDIYDRDQDRRAKQQRIRARESKRVVDETARRANDGANLLQSKQVERVVTVEEVGKPPIGQSFEDELPSQLSTPAKPRNAPGSQPSSSPAAAREPAQPAPAPSPESSAAPQTGYPPGPHHPHFGGPPPGSYYGYYGPPAGYGQPPPPGYGPGPSQGYGPPPAEGQYPPPPGTSSWHQGGWGHDPYRGGRGTAPPGPSAGGA